jgi:hypothetical protein
LMTNLLGFTSDKGAQQIKSKISNPKFGGWNFETTTTAVTMETFCWAHDFSSHQPAAIIQPVSGLKRQAQARLKTRRKT